MFIILPIIIIVSDRLIGHQSKSKISKRNKFYTLIVGISTFILTFFLSIYPATVILDMETEKFDSGAIALIILFIYAPLILILSFFTMIFAERKFLQFVSPNSRIA